MIKRAILACVLALWASVAQATPAIDGTAGWAGCGGGSPWKLSLTLSTTQTHDAIFFVIGTLSGLTPTGFGVSVTDTAGLTWQKRAQLADPIQQQNKQEEWYAPATTALTGDVITITMQPATYTCVAGTVFGVSGAQWPTPFDPLFTYPKTSTAGGPMTVSTLGTDDLIFAHYDTHDCASPTAGLGWTAVVNPTSTFNLVQYNTYAAAQTALAIPVGAACATHVHNGIAEALVSADGLGVLEQNSKLNAYAILQTGMGTSKQNMYVIAEPGIGTSKQNAYAVLQNNPAPTPGAFGKGGLILHSFPP